MALKNQYVQVPTSTWTLVLAISLFWSSLLTSCSIQWAYPANFRTSISRLWFLWDQSSVDYISSSSDLTVALLIWLAPLALIDYCSDSTLTCWQHSELFLELRSSQEDFPFQTNSLGFCSKASQLVWYSYWPSLIAVPWLTLKRRPCSGSCSCLSLKAFKSNSKSHSKLHSTLQLGWLSPPNL